MALKIELGKKHSAQEAKAVVDELDGAAKTDARSQLVEGSDQKMRLGFEDVVRVSARDLDGGGIGQRGLRREQRGGRRHGGQEKSKLHGVSCSAARAQASTFDGVEAGVRDVQPGVLREF